jgi:outer membrane protein TolC
MAKQILFGLFRVFLLAVIAGRADAQVLTIKQAVQNALNNYGTIRAKANYVKAARANVSETRREYLPDVNFALSQDYGTVGSNYGPYAGYKLAPVSSSGPVLATQNWNAAFGALYMTNVNWDFFQFGKYKEKTMVATSTRSVSSRVSGCRRLISI